MTEAGLLVDSQGRVLRDLRVSITDRCNFRCLYCLPETEAAQNFYRGHWARLPNPKPIVPPWVPKTHILSFEEIERVIRLARCPVLVVRPTDHLGLRGTHIPQPTPPCPACVARRRETGGDELWCGVHGSPQVRPHVTSYTRR